MTDAEPISTWTEPDVVAVTGLVRLLGHQGGPALLCTFETWAVEQGARQLSAVSAAATDSAHRFYQRRGYHEAGVRYTRLV